MGSTRCLPPRAGSSLCRADCRHSRFDVFPGQRPAFARRGNLGRAAAPDAHQAVQMRRWPTASRLALLLLALGPHVLGAAAAAGDTIVQDQPFLGHAKAQGACTRVSRALHAPSFHLSCVLLQALYSSSRPAPRTPASSAPHTGCTDTAHTHQARHRQLRPQQLRARPPRPRRPRAQRAWTQLPSQLPPRLRAQQAARTLWRTGPSDPTTSGRVLSRCTACSALTFDQPRRAPLT